MSAFVKKHHSLTTNLEQKRRTKNEKHNHFGSVQYKCDHFKKAK
jgi:hypothetical protein